LNYPYTAQGEIHPVAGEAKAEVGPLSMALSITVTKKNGILVLAYYDFQARNNKTLQLLPGETIVIGRDENCDIVIPKNEVSAQHSLLTYEIDGTLTLRDTYSFNPMHLAIQENPGTVKPDFAVSELSIPSELMKVLVGPNYWIWLQTRLRKNSLKGNELYARYQKYKTARIDSFDDRQQLKMRVIKRYLENFAPLLSGEKKDDLNFLQGFDALLDVWDELNTEEEIETFSSPSQIRIEGFDLKMSRLMRKGKIVERNYITAGTHPFGVSILSSSTSEFLTLFINKYGRPVRFMRSRKPENVDLVSPDRLSLANATSISLKYEDRNQLLTISIEYRGGRKQIYSVELNQDEVFYELKPAEQPVATPVQPTVRERGLPPVVERGVKALSAQATPSASDLSARLVGNKINLVDATGRVVMSFAVKNNAQVTALTYSAKFGLAYAIPNATGGSEVLQYPISESAPTLAYDTFSYPFVIFSIQFSVDGRIEPNTAEGSSNLGQAVENNLPDAETTFEVPNTDGNGTRNIRLVVRAKNNRIVGEAYDGDRSESIRPIVAQDGSKITDYVFLPNKQLAFGTEGGHVYIYDFMADTFVSPTGGINAKGPVQSLTVYANGQLKINEGQPASAPAANNASVNEPDPREIAQPRIPIAGPAPITAPDGRRAVFLGSRIHIYPQNDQFGFHLGLSQDPTITAAGFGSNNYFAYGRDDGEIRVYPNPIIPFPTAGVFKIEGKPQTITFSDDTELITVVNSEGVKFTYERRIGKLTKVNRSISVNYYHMPNDGDVKRQESKSGPVQFTLGKYATFQIIQTDNGPALVLVAADPTASFTGITLNQQILIKSESYIGVGRQRDQKNTIIISGDAEVSRHHLQIYIDRNNGSVVVKNIGQNDIVLSDVQGQNASALNRFVYSAFFFVLGLVFAGLYIIYRDENFIYAWIGFILWGAFAWFASEGLRDEMKATTYRGQTTYEGDWDWRGPYKPTKVSVTWEEAFHRITTKYIGILNWGTYRTNPLRWVDELLAISFGLLILVLQTPY
jgi:pSer/pThr/pTyr-binding forkhead associated (FHA) protein